MRNTGAMKYKSGIVNKGVRDNTTANQKNVSHAIYFPHIFLIEKCHYRGNSHFIKIPFTKSLLLLRLPGGKAEILSSHHHTLGTFGKFVMDSIYTVTQYFRG